MEQQSKDILFWIWLSRRFGAGSQYYPALLERFGTPYDIYNAEDDDIATLMPELSLRDRRALANKNLDERMRSQAIASVTTTPFFAMEMPAIP